MHLFPLIVHPIKNLEQPVAWLTTPLLKNLEPHLIWKTLLS